MTDRYRVVHVEMSGYGLRFRYSAWAIMDGDEMLDIFKKRDMAEDECQCLNMREVLNRREK